MTLPTTMLATLPILASYDEHDDVSRRLFNLRAA